MSEEIGTDLDFELASSDLCIHDTKKSRQIEDILKGLRFSRKTIERIKETFENELDNGLLEKPSSLPMENTYIPELPDGTENGKFLALDLGGTNFRILYTEFEDGEIIAEVIQNYEIAEKVRLGPGVDLFDYIADCVYDFLKQNKMQETEIPLGFTFSFPIKQHSLQSGVLLSWTKSFKCSDVVGKDVVQLLNESMAKKGCRNVSVDVILNDTTGTLIMGALLEKRTAVGLIIGTGSNACYIEKADKVKHWETVRHGEKEVIIDIEWGAFGDNGVLDFIKTEFDFQVDKNSLLTNSFTFEKYISGKYLGEIVRIILVKLISEGLLFDGNLSNALETPQSFLSEYISKIEQDSFDETVANTLDVLKKLGVKHYTRNDFRILHRVCNVVVNRSALLVSVCLSVLLDRMDREEIVIAVTGSVFEKHPSYRYKLEQYIKLLTKKKFKLMKVSDGSGKGAAVAVAIVKKIERRLKDS